MVYDWNLNRLMLRLLECIYEKCELFHKEKNNILQYFSRRLGAVAEGAGKKINACPYLWNLRRKALPIHREKAFP